MKKVFFLIKILKKYSVNIEYHTVKFNNNFTNKQHPILKNNKDL